jgi:hypothetical protein
MRRQTKVIVAIVVSAVLMTLTQPSFARPSYGENCASCHGTSQGPIFGVTPLSLTPTAVQGTSPANATFTVRNTRNGTLNYTITDNAAWLTISPTSGSSTGPTQIITHTVQYSTASLAPGSYTAAITLTAPYTSNSPQTINVTLTISPAALPPTISLSPTSLSPTAVQGLNPANGSFTISNTGGGTLSYSISDNATWLTVSPTSGSTTGPANPITVQYSSASLAAGTYLATITVSAPGATNNPQTIGVTLTITAAPQPTILLNKTSLSPVSVEGANPPNDTFTVSNVGGGTLNFTVTDDTSWLTVSPTSGSTTTAARTITVQYSTTSLAAGVYTATITVSDPNATNNPQTITVDLTITAAPQPIILLNKSSLSPESMEGDNPPNDTFTVSNSGGGTLSYFVSVDADWLAVAPASGSTTGAPQTITVQYDTALLPAGTYPAVIAVSDVDAANDPQTIAVTLTISPPAPPTILLNKTSLAPQATEGSSPPDDIFTVSNSGGGILNYTVSVDADWLFVSPESGSTTGPADTITVQYETASLAAGTYAATISVSDPEATNDPQSISVGLTIRAAGSRPTISLNKASLTPSARRRTNPRSDTFTVRNTGSGTLNYRITDNASWLSVSPTRGSSTGSARTITVRYSTSSMQVGTYRATITVSDPDSTNNPQRISVTLRITSGGGGGGGDGDDDDDDDDD